MPDRSDAEEHLPRVSVRLSGVPRTRLTFVAQHNLRLGTIPGYVDTTRTGLNRVLFGEASGNFKAAAQACAQRYESRVRQKVQPKQAVLVEGIITFSRAAQPVVSNDLEKAHGCALQLAASIVRDHGRGAALVSLVYHADESAPHYHFVMEGVGADGLAVLRQMHKRQGVNLQDLAGQAFAPMGIQRGIPVVARIRSGADRSKIVHRSVRELHRDLPQEIARVQQQIATETNSLTALEEKARTTQERLHKAQADLAQLRAQSEVDTVKVAKLEERIKDYSARLAKQQVKIAAIAPKPVAVTVVTGTERGLLGSRPRTVEQALFPVAEVEAFVAQVQHDLLRAEERALEAERERLRVQKKAERLRALLLPYPQLGWRVRSRQGGENGLEFGRLIHADADFVYAVDAKCGELIEGRRPADVRLDAGMVLTFDANRVVQPDAPGIRPWGLRQVIAAIRRFVVEGMPSWLATLTQQLAAELAQHAKEVAPEAHAAHEAQVEAEEGWASDLAPVFEEEVSGARAGPLMGSSQPS